MARSDDLSNSTFHFAIPSEAMIDKLCRRGRRGVEAFLEVLEYDYTELYTMITGKGCRPPPEGI